MTIKANAQIPNGGFENWTGTNEYPTGWTSCNLAGGPSYPVSKSLDHYPSSIGSYSVKMESNTVAIGLGNCGHGFLKTALYLGDWGPAFPITGHPNRFAGYYKFLPQNNDTMMITLYLFQGGAIVASAILTNASSATSWTSFNIPISSYVTADSAEISFSAFFGQYGQSPAGPWGNSVMYIDNISFDNLITGISEVKETNSISVYPNPFSSQTTLQTDKLLKSATLTVYNLYGQTVKQMNNLSGQTITLQRDNLPSGLYFVRLTQDNKIITEDKLVITD